MEAISRVVVQAPSTKSGGQIPQKLKTFLHEILQRCTSSPVILSLKMTAVACYGSNDANAYPHLVQHVDQCLLESKIAALHFRVEVVVDETKESVNDKNDSIRHRDVGPFDARLHTVVTHIHCSRHRQTNQPSCNAAHHVIYGRVRGNGRSHFWSGSTIGLLPNFKRYLICAKFGYNILRISQQLFSLCQI